MDEVVPWVNEVTGDEGVTLQQDEATSHTAKMVQDWCKNSFKAFWPKEVWPPSSPDLNPIDFCKLSIFEQKAFAVSHPSVEVLKAKLKKSWEEIDEEVVRVTCATVMTRLCRVVK